MYFSIDILGLVIAILLAFIPGIIASKRGITGKNLKTIRLLSWAILLSLFFSPAWVLWIAAVVLAFVWMPNGKFYWEIKDPSAIENVANHGETGVDQLEKLYALKEKGAISKEEFDAQKQKLLG